MHELELLCRLPMMNEIVCGLREGPISLVEGRVHPKGRELQTNPRDDPQTPKGASIAKFT